VGQLGKRIVEVAPRRRTEINSPPSAKIIRDWAPDNVEGGSTVGGNGFDEVSRSIERKAQGDIALVVAKLATGKASAVVLPQGDASWRASETHMIRAGFLIPGRMGNLQYRLDRATDRCGGRSDERDAATSDFVACCENAVEQQVPELVWREVLAPCDDLRPISAMSMIPALPML
jgi:hypothetical protein